MNRLFKHILYTVAFFASFSAVYFFPNSLTVKAAQSDAPTTLKLSIPFQVDSKWTNFTPKNNVFVADATDTWFVYGWFGSLELNKINANRYPLLDNRHQAIDYSAKEGRSVVAAADGRIGYVGSLYGTTVSIRHIEGYETIYGHLSRTDVVAGQKVKKGDIIGAAGYSGTVNSHLHFELRRYTEEGVWAINPRKLLATDWSKVIIPDFPANRFFLGDPHDPDQQADFLLPISYNIPK
jgi:murein DD-endopeptidase MepM/ murein hydrolase activator NlpD